jgi:arabinan endo-1,5-alpha-L-arabinosidase
MRVTALCHSGLVIALIGLAATGPLAKGEAPAAASSINDAMSGDISPAHDPAIIKQDDTYYVFTTSQERDKLGMIHIRSSKDLKQWTRVGSVFPEIPAWARKAIPKTAGIWAPDVSFVDGRYRVYYSVSTFGSNRSAIGLATNATLDPNSPDYAWRDEGEVISSNRADDFNAIDPNLVVDREGKQWLAFGSFWTGLKMVRLDNVTGKRSTEDRKMLALARRPTPGAVEAPFIIERRGYYYLFASYDFCCRGAESSYYTMVGRSKEVGGPYVDFDGKPMMRGHGQVVLHAQLDKTKRWRGPGHVSILRDGASDYIVYHAYDTQNKGVPTLRVAPLGWTADGWPVARL